MNGAILLWMLAGAAGAADDVADELGFVFFGDGGTGRTGQRRVAEAVDRYCETQRCDFVALLGDNIYPDGVISVDDPQWQRKFEGPYAALDLVFRPALGNHDHHGDVSAQVQYSERSERWDMPASYYSFEQGSAAFFVLDTERMDWRQRRWLARGLRHSSAVWNIVYGHHPLLSYGRHGPEQSVRRQIGCLVERHADFYLAGHDHDQQVLRGQRAVYVVMGSGGVKTRAVEQGPETQFAVSGKGFGHLLLQGDTARLTVVGADGSIRFEHEYGE